MKTPEVPTDESQRLASLKRLEILDTPAEERYDRITRLAQRSLNTDIALMSLVDSDRQWFKSAQGLEASETSREISFCAHAIVGDEALVVEDASRDPRFADNPLVEDSPNIRLYAGQPIRAPDGHRIGTLCVIDSQPRTFGFEEIQVLQDLAILVEGELRADLLSESEKELRQQLEAAERRASVDALTRLWNRSGIDEILHLELARSRRHHYSIAVAMIDIDHFKQINDAHGHAVGDEALKEVAARLRRAVRPYDSVGRYGGEEFLAILVNIDRAKAEFIAERIRSRIGARPLAAAAESVRATVSVGVRVLDDDRSSEPAAIIADADSALYEAKHRGRDQVVICGVA